MRALLIILFIAISSVLGFTQDKVYSITEDSTQQLHLPVPKVKQLIKSSFGLPLLRQSTFTPYWITLSTDAVIEYKIMEGISLLGGLENNFSFTSGAQLYSLELPLSLRYYFAIGRRMRQRSDRHSFFSHYVGFQTHNVIFTNLYYSNDPRPRPDLYNYYRGRFLNKVTNLGTINESFNLMQYAYFQVGTQFKVARNNYVDINAVIPVAGLIYNKYDYTLFTPAVLTIRYGLVWQR